MATKQPMWGTAHHGRRKSTRRRLKAALVVLALGILFVPAGSYAAALMAPGNTSFSVRTVEWVRDHHGAFIVAFLENA